MSSGEVQRARAVLVVEDDLDVRVSLADAIEATARRVFVAVAGTEALRRLEGSDIPRPCLIFLDWKRPGKDGREFLERLSAREDAAQLAVIVLTDDSTLPAGGPIPGVAELALKADLDFDALVRVLDKYA